MTLGLPRLVKTKSPLQTTVDCRQIQIIRLSPDQYKYTDEIAGGRYIPSICELSSNTYELLITEFSASDHPLALQINLYDRLSTIFIFILIYSIYSKYI